ncbi:cytochrome P450 3A6-like [Dermacentor albipictus]|uniref:cytochrome P450 3A6-like n=1 Tax=Dermacentor albipictus TaxID=60249 RepID=UPI0038FC8EBD
MLLQAAFILVLSSAFVWVIRRRHRHGLFERLGVPGPKPDLLCGNWKQLKKDRIRVMDQWIQHYGKVLGIYLGDKPFMVITDVELIKECFIKTAKVFQDRPTYAIDVDPFKSGLPFIRGGAKAWYNYEGLKYRSWPELSADMMAIFHPLAYDCDEPNQRRSATGPRDPPRLLSGYGSPLALEDPTAQLESDSTTLGRPASRGSRFETRSRNRIRGEKFREVRSVFNACFTAGKVKELFGIIDTSMMGLVQKFDEAARFGDMVDAHEASYGMVLEMVTKTLLGRQADRQKKSDDPVLKSLHVIFEEADNALFESVFAYPGLRSILQCLYPFTSVCKAVQNVLDHTVTIINKRRRGETERKEDVLQHILDAQEGVGSFVPTARINARFLDDHKLACNIALHIIGGFETTSASLAFLLYLLAKHPEEQQKVRAEIHRGLCCNQNYEIECGINNFEEKQGLEQKRCQPRDNVPGSSRSHSSDNPTNSSQNSEYEGFETKHAERTDMPKASSHQRSEKSELDEDDVMLLQRLDMVVREGLRLYPAIPIAIMRECVEDTTILGRFIPEGTAVFAPPWHVHRNPEIWPEPNRFIPDRFSPKQRDSVTSSYFSFGLGPRVCVARRLGMVTLKTALYRLIKNFEISLAEDTQDPLPIRVDHVIVNPAVPIKLRVKRIKLD